ncbi:cytochrome b6-f complex iron-sulfur subunit [Pseudarcicella hirudinis]|uniref:Cytochrome b6-f complex iron-sulfur subunit n=1 Tax=Pseudarcicella hirudinis TaxID=1079859 RepID=A0A1I5UU94_9BACT|nr:Rieske 2Fe-2S domain-containing protein [Pseudarcicella hirudinis]SFP98884.1 cytochrome b6-f complex iron-sulfur subunit [Pseudarcicella hirudinis]
MERKEFLSLVGISVGAIILNNCMTSCSSSKNDPQPANGGGSTGGGTSGKVDLSLNLNDATYVSLKTNGTGLVVGSVIVARTKDGDFIAVSKTCTHEGTTINFDNASTGFICPNHGSRFDRNGNVTLGPAAIALKQYKTSFDSASNILKVTE